MCTLTIVPCDDALQGLRIACNRDESRLRPAALVPEVREFGRRRAMLPIDPLGGGTWIAASDAPLALVLMNVYVRPIGSEPIAIGARTTPPISRGTIIPHALAADSVAGALERARELDVAQFEPFRLVIAARRQFAEIVWAAGHLDVRGPAPIERPLFFTSSGLGDDVVAHPRRRLFEECFAAAADWPAAQDAFHRHEWPGREFSSVWMTRPEARTVSLTVVEMGPQEVRMRYYARTSDDSPANEAKELSLPIELR